MISLTYLEQNEEFRGILNSGHTPDTANVWRCVGQDHDPKSFTTRAPMAIAKIGALPDTLATRSISIPMRRKRYDEQVEKFDAIQHGPIVEELARRQSAGQRTICRGSVVLDQNCRED